MKSLLLWWTTIQSGAELIVIYILDPCQFQGRFFLPLNLNVNSSNVVSATNTQEGFRV